MEELDRRTLLRGLGGAAVAGALVLSGCGTPRTQAGRRGLRLGGSCPPRRSSWSSPTGRSTSTRTTKGYTSTLADFEKATGIKVAYTADVNDNNEFFAKVQNQLGSCTSDQARHVHAHRLDGRPHDPGRLDPEARRAPTCPTCTPTSSTAWPSVSFDTKREYSAPVAERPHRHRLQQVEGQGGQVLRGAPHPQRPQGTHLAAVGDERHDGPAAAHRGSRPGRLHRRRVADRRWTSSRRP